MGMNVLQSAAALALALGAATPERRGAGADAPPPPDEFCDAPELVGEGVWLDAPGGVRLQAAVVGDGPNVAIFLHQTDGGYCGFADFVTWLSTDEDVRSILVNLCGNGESDCPSEMVEGNSGNVAVQTASDWAVANGAERVTVVGASLGGIQALTAAATDGVNEHIDAVVDLSGPAQFLDLDSEAVAPDVTVPVLMAGSESDWRPTDDDVRRIAALLGTDDVEVRIAEHGHGWELLEPNEIEGEDTVFRQLVLAWITGAA
jgi:hypothetical protein